MIQRKFRNYEVSLWTLQDDFLIVLKYAHLEHNGQIQEPELVLNIDGTQEFTFTIPMYIRENGEKKENPIWYNYINGNLIASLRKIKVIINKNEDNEKILEFLITSVTERHEKEELYCDVKCEGLAFHELGKTGYKISLSSDDFYEEDRVWFENDGLIILLQPISVQAALGETITLSCVAQNATSYQWQNKLKTSTSDEWNNSGLSGNNTRSIRIQATAARYNYLWRCKITGQHQQEIYTDAVTINSGSAANNPDRSSLEQHVIDNAINWSEEGPRATLQYWCNKFLEPYSESAYRSPNKWYYKLEMDWSSLKEVVPSDKDKVYEEDYVSSWDVVGDQLIPRDTQQAKEKERLVDLEESNKYNLTQDLARTFGVYCRYEYVHDTNYHITGRNVVFYNNFYTESNNVLDIDYKYDSTSISRTMDGTDLVTKMYVRPVDTGIGETGLITIINSDANPSKEDYLLNFDYLYSIGAIDEDLYKEVRVYEKDMAAINMQLIPLEPIITTLVTELPSIEAKKTVAQDAISLDQERIKAAKEFIEHLTNDEGVLYVTSNYPDTCVLLADSEKEANYYHILISKQGVKSSTIRVFLNYNFQHQDGEEPLTNELNSFSIDYDEDGNVSGLSNIYLTDRMMPVTHCVYLTYTYEPNDHYRQTRDTWERRLSKDEQDLRRLTAEYEQKTSELQIAQTKYDQLVIEKQNRVHDFERLMGAALREGYWQPEDYNDYGDKYKDQFSLKISGDPGESGHSTFVWEPATETTINNSTQVNYFFGEQLNYYELGINQTKTYYPLILLNGQQLSNIQQHLDNLSFIFSDESVTNNYPQHYRVMALGSECQLIFVKKNDTGVVQAAIILTGIEHLIPAPTQNNDGPILYTFNNACLGQLTTSYNPNTNAVQVNIKKYVDNLTVTQTGASKYTVVYPRIIINSLNVKDSEDQLLLKYQNTSLSQYGDYSITTRVKESSSEFCITLKPTTLVGRGTIEGTLDVAFSISNANTSIYLDAIQVLRDSSRPQVSYEINVDVLAPDLHKQLPHQLGAIVNINDQDLHFQNVQGYISGLDLFLDKPWDDKIEIKNYKTKFEDLFTTIVASTEEMHKNEYITGVVSQAFSSANQINENVIKNSMLKADLNYQFNNGKLTIDEANGIWGTSDLGVVAFRGGGIFTATEKDAQGNWYWNTGIIPTGINADLITTGQLDTNLVRIFAGDKVKLQLNADGLIAYKSILDDDEFKLGLSHLQTNPEEKNAETWFNKLKANNLDMKQYVVHNDQGLFLRAEENAIVLKKDEQGDEQLHELTFTEDEKNKYIDRVAITWDGLTLRNWNNEKTLWAEADTGDLTVKGNIQATSLTIVRPDGDVELPEGAVDLVLSTETYYTYSPNKDSQPWYPDDQHQPNLPENSNFIAEQPKSINATTGVNVSLSVKVIDSAKENASYQWQNRSLTAANAQWANSTRPGNNTAKVTSEVVSGSYNYEWRCQVTISRGINDPITVYTLPARIYPTDASLNLDRNAGWYTTFADAKQYAGENDIYFWQCTKTTYAYAGSKYEYLSGDDMYIQVANNVQSIVDENIEVLQRQVDGEIDTWFYKGAPEPREAVEDFNTFTFPRITPRDLEKQWGLTWNNGYDDEDKIIILRHFSDIYYDIGIPPKDPNNVDSQNGESLTAGRAYRFIVRTDDSIVKSYQWQEITDTTMTEALAQASRAQVTADSKIKTFYAEKEPNPNTVEIGDGDLWVKSTNNQLYRWDAHAIPAARWISIRDTGIEQAQNLADAITDDIDILKSQLDGAIDTWFMGTNPGETGDPALTWSIEKKQEHVGDIFYNTKSGKLWRYTKIEEENTVTYKWEPITDATRIAAFSTALEHLLHAQATADGKIRTFYGNSEPDANVSSQGDLWINSTDNKNILYRYDNGEWKEVRDKGIKEATDFVNAIKIDMGILKQQLDGSIETWFKAYDPESNKSPTVDWNTNELKDLHIGDIFYNINTKKAWRFVKVDENNYSWQKIGDTVLVSALQGISHAQETADGKISTFYQNSEPDASISSYGDLWIDSDDSNKLYRYNGSQWQPVRDAGITQAITNADLAQQKAQDAKDLVNSIHDGTWGLKFEIGDEENKITQVQLDTEHGLKIIGTSIKTNPDSPNSSTVQSYFQVNNTAMGFFTKSTSENTPDKVLLGAQNGNLYLYNKLFVDEGKSWFGPDGLKLGDVLEIKQSGSDYTLDSLVIKAGSKSTDALLALKPIIGKDENGNDITTYKLYLDPTLLPDREEYMRWATVGTAITTGHSYYVTEIGQLPTAASIGSLGFVYPSTITSSSSSSSTAPTLSAKVVAETPPAISNHIYSEGNTGTYQYRYKTFFGMYGVYWNVNQGGNNDDPADNYARAGHGGSVILCYAIAPLKLTVSSTDYSTNQLTVTFKYRYNYANHIWDAPNGNWTHSRQITGYLIKASTYTATSYTILSKTTISLNTSTEIQSSTILSGQANFSFSLTKFSNNDILYFVVGDDQDQTWRVTKNPQHTGERRLNESYSNTQNCIYVCTQGNDAPKIGNTTAAETTTNYTVGAYIKSVYGWDSLSTGSSGGNSGGTVYTAGDGISINSSEVAINLADKSGLTATGGLKINCGSGLEINSDTDQLSIAPSAPLGIGAKTKKLILSWNPETLKVEDSKLTVKLDSAGGLTQTTPAATNSGLKINLSNTSSGLKVEGNILKVKCGTGLEINNSGQLCVTNTGNSGGGTTYSQGNGIQISGSEISVKLASQSGLTATDGLKINLATNSGLTTDSGLSIKLADNSLTLTSAGLKVTNPSGSSISAGKGLSLNSGSMSIDTSASKGLFADSSGLSIKLANDSGLILTSTGLKLNHLITLKPETTDSISRILLYGYENSESWSTFMITTVQQHTTLTMSNSDGSNMLRIMWGDPTSSIYSSLAYNNYLYLNRKMGSDFVGWRILHSGMYTTPAPTGTNWKEVKWYYNTNDYTMCFTKV